MKKPIGMFAIVALVLMTSNVHAGILGKRYIGVEVGQINFGEDGMKDIFGSAFSYGANLRLPVNDRLDFLANIRRAETDGDQTWHSAPYDYYLKAEETQTSFSGGLQYQLPMWGITREKVNPFILGEVLWVRSAGEVSLERRIEDTLYPKYLEQVKDDDIGFKIGGGVEINIREFYDGPEMSIDVIVNYQSEIFDNDDFTAGVGFSAWVTPKLLLRIGAQHAFDSGNNVIQADVAFGF